MDIFNLHPARLITGTESNDSIYNFLDGEMVTINALGGDDSISNNAERNSIDGGAGNDEINNSTWGSLTAIEGGSGSDTIKSESWLVTIDVGDGNDYIYNRGNNSTIDGGAGNDTVVNDGSNVTIEGGKGRDIIYAANALIKYSAGDGSDIIRGFGENTTLTIGGSDYSSEKSGDDIIVMVGDDNITLKGAATLSTVNIKGVYKEELLITGTEYADNIKNKLYEATINALGGNDTVTNSGKNVRINTSEGNDVISLSSEATNNIIYYKVGEGNDLIKGFRANTTLNITGGYYTSEKSGNDIIVTVGDEKWSNLGKITLSGAAANLSQVNIIGTKAKYTDKDISNNERNVLIIGNDSGNNIKNRENGATINALGGNDSISNTDDKVSIKAGADNDVIDNYKYFVKIYGGSGSDSIKIEKGANTISAGTGDDTISLASGAANNLIEYRAGEGNDIIYGFNDTSTLDIGEGNAATWRRR